jgi:hypothetical protein
LLETQEKLKEKRKEDEKDQKRNTKQDPGTLKNVEDKKLFGHIEELVFVSKKNRLNLSEDQELKSSKKEEKLTKQGKTENALRVRKEKEKLSSPFKIEEFKNKTFDLDLPPTNSSPFQRFNSPKHSKSPKMKSPESFRPPSPLKSEKSLIQALESSLAGQNALNQPASEKSLKSLDSVLSSIQSFKDFEAILSNPEDFQTKNSETLAKPSLFLADLKETQSFMHQGTTTDLAYEGLKENFTFEPVFKIMTESFPDPSKTLIKKSRNSSLPWIDEGIDGEKLKIKTEKKTAKLRPKTQEKPFILRPGRNNLRNSIMSRKPASQPKDNKVQIRARANSHGKTKAKVKPADKHTTRHLVKEDILDDIIFDEEQDMATWTKLMNKFRQNPVIISRLLKSRGRPSTQEDFKRNTKRFEKIDQVEYIGAQTSLNQNPEVSSINSVIDYRPFSAPEIAPVPLSKNFRKIKDPDWSTSLLDTFVTQNKKKFNFIGDLNLLNSQEIEDFIKMMQNDQITEENQRKMFRKAGNTLEALKKELILPEFWISLPPFCTESLAQALSKCQKLFKARTLTIKAIELIHYRENLLLDIMSIAKGDKEKFAQLEKVNDELLQVLVFWKYMELPFTSFVYLGEDYYAKIHEDNSNLASIFPQFKVENIFKAQVSSDSFDFDI